ncbi:hypothetical protein [Pectobacterium parmentieri]|uniref:hypothetical protein n=1 Tax=Pectobacterium parmentieri TaxID=1905730 RepID=UPI000CDE0B1F|nr:hypothetical protein [Pectobacterium parmentieri]AYH07209.1 hypothetical protein C5E25_18515 [Pectobacterium parmentieri]AYH16019.1 hypothetical protein C5E23_18450 [Pectobacterium parmentieri]AYH24728.1 hypothetical protein C5E21_18530 [Pectobacterium parmentieri]MBN3176053.1 hypothetical protein [Pectobacterium parmentieri]POW29019.1 hypothetical protein PB20LOC_01452 [Pectobacterium parmentieri]
MSLELVADLNAQIAQETQEEILLTLQSKYQKVYTSTSENSGFVRYGEEYKIKAPPLFDIFILKDKVILSVYGNLTDQRTITDQVSNAFLAKNISIYFSEE